MTAFAEVRLDDDERYLRTMIEVGGRQAADVTAADLADLTAVAISILSDPAAREVVLIWPDSGVMPPQELHRLLREVEIKRAILALHKPDRQLNDQWFGHDVRCEECGGIGGSVHTGPRGFQRSWPCGTLRQLVAAWSGHPDYRQEWRP